MGITGLIPFLKNASREVSLGSFPGATVAVDAYCWLHRGAYSCSDKIVRGEPTDGYVQYCIKRINMLLSFKLKPIIVFDGQHLPAKSLTEAKRHENREAALRKGKMLLREGKIKEARDCFQRCINITPEMAHELFKACTDMGVDCIVAPYEADAQLSYLFLKGFVDIVISEDSDLILFGCDRVLYKMDNNGTGLLIEKSKLNLCFGQKPSSFTFQKFRYMCILSGCDYLPSLPGIGLKKALKFFSAITNPDIKHVLSKLPGYLNMPNLPLTADYIEGFIQADYTFLYQLVFCPKERKLVPLNPYPPGLDLSKLTYAGKYFSNEIAHKLASGQISCKDLKPFEQSAAVQGGRTKSIWNKNYQKVSPCEKSSTGPNENRNAFSTEKKVVILDTRRTFGVKPQTPDYTETVNEAVIFKLYATEEDFSMKIKQSEDTHMVCSPDKKIDSFKSPTDIGSTIVKSRYFRKVVNNPGITEKLPPVEDCIDMNAPSRPSLVAVPNIKPHISPFLKKIPAQKSSCLDAVEDEYLSNHSVSTAPVTPLRLITTFTINRIEVFSSEKSESDLNLYQKPTIEESPNKISGKEKLGKFSWSRNSRPTDDGTFTSIMGISKAARQSFKPVLKSTTINENICSSRTLSGSENSKMLNVSTQDFQDALGMASSNSSSLHSSLDGETNDDDLPEIILEKRRKVISNASPSMCCKKTLGCRANRKNAHKKFVQDLKQPSILDSLKGFAYVKRTVNIS